MLVRIFAATLCLFASTAVHADGASAGTGALRYGPAKELVMPAGYQVSRLVALNAAGAVLADLFDATGGGYHVVKWDADGRYTDLGLPPGNPHGVAMNREGMVAGNISTDVGTRAIRWTEQAGMLLLTLTPGATNSTAIGVDDLGRVFGITYSPGYAVVRTVRWDRQGRVVQLPGLGGQYDNVVAGSPGGRLTGISDDPQPWNFAVKWSSDGRITRLDNPPGRSSSPTGIADDGSVTGMTSSTCGYCIPARWSPRGSVAEFTPPGMTYGTTGKINRQGTILGLFYTGEAIEFFTWDSRGRIIYLDHPAANRWARDLNDSGVVAGYSEARAAVWNRAGRISFLEPLVEGGWSTADFVNGRGTVAGESTRADGRGVPVVWRARP